MSLERMCFVGTGQVSELRAPGGLTQMTGIFYMTFKLRMALAAIGALGAVALGSSAAVAAACSTGAEGKLTQNPGAVVAVCEAGLENNDKLNPLQVNADALHGYTDWIFAGKHNFGDDNETGDANIGFATSGGLQSGTWEIAGNAFSLYEDVMIVIKGGKGNNTQENYVGYLLSSLLGTTGDYLTPFFTNDGNAKDISHISAYVRGTPTVSDDPSAIPLPAAGVLLMSALAGLGFMSRRRAA